MATNTTVGVLLAITAAISGICNVGCGARVQADRVTETGNPSFIDQTRITATPLDGVIVVKGEAGAVPKGAKVTVVVEDSAAEQQETAAADGSFELTLGGNAGDTVVITVVVDGRSETKQLLVESTTETTDSTGESSSPSSSSSSDSASVDVTASPSGSVDVPPPPPRVPLNHRPERETCDDQRPPGSFEDNTVEAWEDVYCSRDADCVDGVRGRCLILRSPTCSYDECSTDSDCSTGGPCGCEMGLWSDANACMAGNCQIDGDCGSNGYCSPSMGTCGSYSGVIGYWCHTATDECVDDTDCVNPDMGPGYCMYSPEATHWLCSYSSCVG